MPSAFQNVRVNLADRSYDIEIGAGNLAACRPLPEGPRQGLAGHYFHR